MPDEEPKNSPIQVITLHGINTRGAWQKELGDLLSENGCITNSLDYGHFWILQFILSCSRKKKLQWLLKEYARVTRGRSRFPCIVAHSHGTWLVAELLRTRPEIRFDQIIFCGSIVHEDFPWTECRKRGQFNRVLNDYAGRDWPVRLAEYVVWTAGTSGRNGFSDNANGAVLQRRNPEFGHSDVFSETNYRNKWIPFLKGEQPTSLDAIDPPPTNWKFICVVCFMLLLVTAMGVLAYRNFHWPSPLDVPLTDSEYPSIETVAIPSENEVNAASVAADEEFQVFIENDTPKLIQVVVYNCYKKYNESDFSQPTWSQLSAISPHDSKPANVKNAKSRLFAFFVRNSTSGFQFLGAFDLRDTRTLVVTMTDSGRFEVGAQPIGVGDQ